MTTKLTAEYTNECSCEIYDEDTNENRCADSCEGWCWDDQLQDFENITEDLFAKYDSWEVKGLPLWGRTVSGKVFADTPKKLLDAITVNGSWRLKVTVEDDGLECVLFHHDVPMGGMFSVKGLIEEGDE